MFNKVGDFLQPKTNKNETRAERRENARKAYKPCQKNAKGFSKRSCTGRKVEARYHNY